MPRRRLLERSHNLMTNSVEKSEVKPLLLLSQHLADRNFAHRGEKSREYKKRKYNRFPSDIVCILGGVTYER